MAAYQCLNCGRIERSDEDCCDKPDLFCINDMPGEILRLRAQVDVLQRDVAAAYSMCLHRGLVPELRAVIDAPVIFQSEVATALAAQAEPIAWVQHCAGYADRAFVWNPSDIDPRKCEWADGVTYTLAYAHPPVAQPAQAEPVATLHDDGCFTWKSDDLRRKYDRQRVGWRMDVYAAAPSLVDIGRGRA